MTLDECISGCEQIMFGARLMKQSEVYEYNEQLAEWLRELKAYRKAEKEIEQELVNWDDIDNGKCRGLFLATSIIQHYKDEEVNADVKK